jgi:hypothetical protein
MAMRVLILLTRCTDCTVSGFCLLYLIESRIEGEKFVISSYRWSVPMLQETYDNRDSLEMLQFLVWHAGVGQWGD